MNYHVARGTKIRIVTILALIGISAGGIVARSVQLQLLKAEKLSRLADQQHLHTIEIKAKRGEILDKRGEALAVSREEAQVYARPDKVANPARTAEKLASVLGIRTSTLKTKISGKEPFVWLTRSASLEQAEAIKLMDLEGIGLLPASRRFYPGKELAANVIGFTGVDGVGLEGLEFHYEKTLAGKPIRIWLERDARGNPIFLSDHEEIFRSGAERRNGSESGNPVLGANVKGISIQLTILRPLQYLVERELAKGVKKARAKSGYVVAMEPDTGKILAMASYPTFDPNRFQKFKQSRYANACLANAYEPGSTFKVFIAAAALDTGVVRKKDRFFCEHGTYMLGGETISDTKAHGWLRTEEIIMYSSNIGASKIGERLGKDRMYQSIRAFGFGQRTEIDFPTESPGILHDPGLWSQVAVGTISFGQGIAVSPLQMVTALSALANGGTLMRPFLVENLILPDGSRQVLNQPRKVRRVIRKEVAKTITGYMEKVVSEKGTGYLARVPGYPVAGKTGTAQKPREDQRGYAEDRYIASFMGFLPASRPRLAMIVVIDEPDPEKPWGGEVAGPVFQAIAEQAMVLLKVPSENEYPAIARADLESDLEDIGESERENRIRQWKQARIWKANQVKQTGNKDMTVPDLKGMTLRQALRKIDGLPVSVQVKGSGIVIRTRPGPGVEVSKNGVIQIQLETAP